MFRWISLLALMPTLAAAQIDVRPAMFEYGATFDACTVDPALASADDCADQLRAAYILNRAVVWAMEECDDTPLAICDVPFEGHGLTAISARIADGVGCDRTGLAALETGAPLTENHCITIIADILRDEGVVPFIQETTCHSLNEGWSDCSDLILIHAQLWEEAIFKLAPDDALIVDLLDKIAQDCAGRIKADEFTAAYLGGVACVTQDYAALWVDLAQTEGDN